jgi:hypothetical protein
VQVDSRLHCSDNRHLTNGLGGQHGEEGSYEVEDQVSGEEDGDQDEVEVVRQEEEVITVDNPASENVDVFVTRAGGLIGRR